MSSYSVCDHCEYAYDQDEVELEECSICFASLCPFCYISNTQAGAVCRKKHDDPDSFPDGNNVLVEVNLFDHFGRSAQSGNDEGRLYYYNLDDLEDNPDLEELELEELEEE